MFPLFRAPLSYVVLFLPMLALVLLGFERQILRQWSNAHLKIDFLVNFLFLNAFHIIAGLTLLALPSVRDWYFRGKDSQRLHRVTLLIVLGSTLMILGLVQTFGSKDIYLPILALSLGLTATHSVLQSHGLSRQLVFRLHSTPLDQLAAPTRGLLKTESHLAHLLAAAIGLLVVLKSYRFYDSSSMQNLNALWILTSAAVVISSAGLAILPLFHHSSFRWPKTLFHLRFVVYAFAPWSFLALALNRGIHAIEYLGIVENSLRHQSSRMTRSDKYLLMGITLPLTALALLSYWPWEHWPWASPLAERTRESGDLRLWAAAANYTALWLSFIHIGMDTLLYRRWSGGIQVLGPIISGQKFINLRK